MRAAKILFGGVKPDGNLLTASTRSCQFEADLSELYVSLDGEVERLKTPLYYSTLPKALRVILP
jgi:diacylglycerol kinase family enzyme